MRLSKTQGLPAQLALSCLLLLSACNGFFTTSAASWLERDIDYSSLSLEQLAKLAATRGAKNSEEAKKILAALASASEDELAGLALEQKSAILKTAINAAFSLDSVLDIMQNVSQEDGEETLRAMLALGDSGVDMTAAKAILQDEETLGSADVGTLILASAALMASVSSEDDIDAIIDAMKKKDASILQDTDLAEAAEIVIDVVAALADRKDEVIALGERLGFDLAGLIPGFDDG